MTSPAPTKGLVFRLIDRADPLEQWEVTSIRADIVYFTLHDMADQARREGRPVRSKWRMSPERFQQHAVIINNTKG